MSLFSALTVAVNGLTAQSAAIGNISDNLSNTSTVGYKRVDTAFEALVTNSNLSVNDPGGVRATPRYQNNIQGNLVQSQSSTALAITGSGFFSVRQGVTGSNGLTTFSDSAYYTRRGDFTLDKDGYLVNGAGYYLTGYTVDSAGLVDKSNSDPIQVSALLDNPVATSQASYTANLPSGKSTGYSSAPSTIQVFDNLGNAREMSFTWSKTGASTTNTWSLSVVVSEGGGSASSNFSITIPFNFDSSGSTAGTLSAYGASTGAGIVAGSGYTVTAPGTGSTDATVSFSLNFAGAGSQTIAVDFGEYQTATGVTQFADTTVSVTSFEQNGIPRGSFQSLEVDKSGFVVLNYDNGRSKTFYQIPIAQFYAADSLQRAAGGAFEKTAASGSPRLSEPGTIGAGKIVGNALEGSNVDIADEFTKMIQSQRVYSANARTISTTNAMLEEVINVIR